MGGDVGVEVGGESVAPVAHVGVEDKVALEVGGGKVVGDFVDAGAGADDELVHGRPFASAGEEVKISVIAVVVYGEGVIAGGGDVDGAQTVDDLHGGERHGEEGAALQRLGQSARA